MNSAQFRIRITLLLVALSAYGAWTGVKWYRALNESESSGEADSGKVDLKEIELPSLADIKLTDSSGKPFSFESLDGEVWVVNLFFTTCRGQCLTITNTVRNLQEDPQLAGAKFVSITCDPEKDTPPRLQAYSIENKADPRRWLFVAGDKHELPRFGKGAFGFPAGEHAHSPHLVLIDRAGWRRGAYDATNPADIARLKIRMAEALKQPRPKIEAASGEELSATSESDAAGSAGQ